MKYHVFFPSLFFCGGRRVTHSLYNGSSNYKKSQPLRGEESESEAVEH